MENHQKKTMRSTKAQITYMCQYMLEHPAFAAGEYRTPLGQVKINAEWLKLTTALNHLGPTKTVEQWKTCWRDQKRKARIEAGAVRQATITTGNIVPIPALSENSALVLGAIGPEMAIGCGPEESPIGFHQSTSEPVLHMPVAEPHTETIFSRGDPNVLPQATTSRQANRKVASDRFLNSQVELNKLIKGPVAPPTPPAAPQPPPMQQISTAPPPTPAASGPPPPPPPPGGAPPAPAVSIASVTSPPPPPPPPAPAPPPDATGLAAQLQQARLKRQAKQTNGQATEAASPPGGQEHSGSSSSSSCSAARAAGTLSCMMNEMQRTLARRRAHLDKAEESLTDNSVTNTPMKSWERSATLPHRLPNTTCNGNTPTSESTTPAAPQSPRSVRKRFGSASEETILKQVNGGNENGCMSAAEMDAFKQEMMREIRQQFNQMKKELLDAMKAELARR